MSFLSLIAQRAQAQPSHVMLKLSDGSFFTYREINKAIRDVHSWLVNENIRKGVIVLDLKSEFEYIACLIACLCDGYQVLPFYKNLHVKERRELIAKVQPSAILEKRPSGKNTSTRVFDDKEGQILHFTSGSFGLKKIVVRPYDNLLDEASSVAATLGITSDDTVLVASPLAHSFGCGMLRAILCAGATLAFSPSTNINSRVIGIRTLLQENVSIVTGVPYIFELLARGEAIKSRHHSTRCFAGGATLRPALAEKWERCFHSPLRQEYGLGEGGISSFAAPSDPSESIGSPIKHVRFVVDNPNSLGVGELIVYRPHPPTRYLFDDSPETFQSDGGIRSGDLAYQDTDKRFYLAGRIKGVINVAGLKVNPNEIESCLMQHPNIEEVVVVGVEDSITGEKPAAFVKHKDRSLTEKEYMRFLSSHLSRFKLPNRILLVTDWPRTESGKIDYKRLTTLL